MQPVIPIKLTADWNLITRTIMPIINQPSLFPGTESAFGLGDINPSLFLSPAKPGAIIWGVGPTFTFPSATDSQLGSGKWSAGPAAVALTIQGVRGERGGYRDAFGGCCRSNSVERAVDHPRQVTVFKGEPHPSGDDAREIEQVLDHLHLGLRVADDDINRARATCRIQVAALKQASPTQYRIDRRP